MKAIGYIGTGLLMAVLMAAPVAADGRDGRAGPKRFGSSISRKADGPAHRRDQSEQRREESRPGTSGFGLRVRSAPTYFGRFGDRDRDRGRVSVGALGSIRPHRSSSIRVAPSRFRYSPGVYSFFSWPSGYFSLSWPYTYTVKRDYTHYVFVDTPAVRAPSTVIQTGPYVFPPAPVPPKAEPKLYDSRLAPMLGGDQQVPVAFALGEESLRGGDFDQAAFAFRQALLEQPDDPAAHVALSLALMAAEDYEGAARALKRGLSGLDDLTVVKLDPPEAFGAGGAYDRIAERLREAAQNDPANRDVQLLLGFHYFAIGHFGQAAEVLWAGQDEAPRDLVMLELLLAAERQSQAQTGEEAPEEEQQQTTE